MLVIALETQRGACAKWFQGLYGRTNLSIATRLQLYSRIFQGALHCNIWHVDAYCNIILAIGQAEFWKEHCMMSFGSSGILGRLEVSGHDLETWVIMWRLCGQMCLAMSCHQSQQPLQLLGVLCFLMFLCVLFNIMFGSGGASEF